MPEEGSVTQSVSDIYSAMYNYLPLLTQLLNSQQLPTAQNEIDVSRAIAPQAAQLSLDLNNQYGRQFADFNNSLATDRRLAEAGADLSVLQGPGRQLATEATDLARDVIDPEFYASRKAVGDKTVELLSGLDPNKLSGGERAEVERGVNLSNVRGGNLGNQSAINTVDNAMHFGNALNNKRSQISSIVSGANSGLQNMRSGIDPFGRPIVNQGDGNGLGGGSGGGNMGNQFGGTFGQSANATNNALLNQTGGFAQQKNEVQANARDGWDYTMDALGAVGGLAAGFG